MSTEQRVFIVDDDEAVRESLGALLESYDFSVMMFISALHFLARCDRTVRGCLLADVRMPDMDGLELQERVAADFPDLAVVIITGHGDVPIAIRAMRAGAVDFIEKPFLEDHILETVRQAMQQARRSERSGLDGAAINSRLTLLTSRERQVLEGLVAGQPNKSIGYDLGISASTVEVFRARILEKMEARSLAALVRMALAAGIVAG